MNRVKRNKLLIIAIYTITHCIMSLFLVLFILSFSGDIDSPPPHYSVKMRVTLKAADVVLNILWAPINLVRHFGCRFPGPYTDWIAIILNGLLYGYILSFLYGKIINLRSR